MALVASNTGLTLPQDVSQPFQCPVCWRRFTRRENLKRHEALHLDTRDHVSLSCQYCSCTFARHDLKIRHIRRKHPGMEQDSAALPLQRQDRTHSTGGNRSRAGTQMSAASLGVSQRPQLAWRRSSTTTTGSASLGIDLEEDEDHDDIDMDDQPSSLSNCSILSSLAVSRNSQSSYADSLFPRQMASQPGGNATNDLCYSSNGSHASSFRDPLNDDQLDPAYTTIPSDLQVSVGFNLYFRHVAPFLPFHHQPTFDASVTPSFLLSSMLSLAYQYGENPDLRETGENGKKLSLRLFLAARREVTAQDAARLNRPGRSAGLAMVQAYILLEVCAILYLGGPYCSVGLEMHSRMAILVRSYNLMRPGSNTSDGRTEELYPLWLHFARTESMKRTLHTALQIDALWYQLLSSPRSFSHLEIKHDLPCFEQIWAAPSAEQWAYRRLLPRYSAPAPSYADTVRSFMTATELLEPLPKIDSNGAISVAYFLLSSIREVSGWTTMTGRVSLDRFEPLKASILALEPFVRHTTDEPSGTQLLCEATWEMAMIELHSWSWQHTGGAVQDSLDDLLARTACQTVSGETFILEDDSARLLQQHIDWFLKYLDSTASDPLIVDPPWVIIYACKAFFIAWELVRRGGACSDAMECVGVPMGDTKAATRWAKTVFHSRRHLHLGNLVYEALDILDD